MNLYSLLVGINDYPDNPLTQCVKDVEKVENYLFSHQARFDQVFLKKLLNRDAIKSSIVNAIADFLSQAADDDVCFFYYSGHGAQEQTGGLFAEEQDGLLECLVAFNDKNIDSGCLIADKEIRYLFSKFRNNPHLISVFDCCHSGDMVKSLGENRSGSRARRLVKSFPPRSYNQFIFSNEIQTADLKNKYLSQIIPDKNHVHLAACLPNELSWEDENGGIFTRYLMHLLETTQSRLNYQEVAKWARISLKDMTSKKQTPTYNIQGTGKITSYSSWLNLFPEGDLTSEAKIVYNKANGWIYTRGKLLGIPEGLKITVLLDGNKTFETTVISSFPEFSLIEDPLKNGVELDLNKEYKAITKTTWSKLSLYINDLENDNDHKTEIESIFRDQSGIQLVGAEAADFFVNIFNQMVYFSQPGDEFRPLAEQIDLLDDTIDYKTILLKQLATVKKWNHFHTLSNPDNSFDSPPIKVEISAVEDQHFTDVTDGIYYLIPAKDKINGMFYQKFRIKVTNVSRDNLYIGVLTLNSDFGISSKPFNNSVIQLEPGKSNFFYDHNDLPAAYATLDSYKVVYNWKNEWIHYKFMVNNFEDFSTSLSDFAQPALNPPVLPDFLVSKLKGSRGEGGVAELKEINEKWGTFSTTICLENPSFNTISGDLEKYWDRITGDERIAPFIGMLYFSRIRKGLILESTANANRLNENQADKGFWDIKLNIANFLDDKRRFRLFLKSKSSMPGKPVVIAEGDSWFLYPFLVKDTIDYVMEEFPVRSLAAAGDTLENYKASSQLLSEMSNVHPEFVLISGGGNDIIGPEIVHILKKNVGEGHEPDDYLNDKYPDRRKNLADLYEYIFLELNKFGFVKRIFVHGYDYVRADHDNKIIRNGWVNKYMTEYGIKDPKDREKLIKYLVNNFNSDLEELTKKFGNVTYLDMRGLVSKDEWYDEIHPNDKGFSKVGNKFITAIKTTINSK